MTRFLSLLSNEFKTHFKWVFYWIVGINAYILMAISIYPGEEALQGFLGLLEDDYFQAFLGTIDTENPGYTLWISLLIPFVSIVFFIFALMLGVRIAVNAISDDTGELIHPQPVSRIQFLTSRYITGIIAICLMFITTSILLSIPVSGESVGFEQVSEMSWWGIIFLISVMSFGTLLGTLAADTGRGNMFSLFLAILFFGLQITGRVFDEVSEINEINPLFWYTPETALIGQDLPEGVIVKILIFFVISSLLSAILFVKRDLIREAAIPLPIFSRFRRSNATTKKGKSDRDKLLVRWGRLFEKRLPFTADFIYSEHRAFLVIFWGIIIFYPAQLLAYNPNDQVFLDTLQETVASFGNSGIMKVFTYGHDLSGNLFLWFLITQAIGNHYWFFVPLVAHWIKKILVADSENLTGEIYGAIPLEPYKVMLQRLLAVVIEIIVIVGLMIFWLVVSETMIGVNVNQTWEIIAIASVIPLYLFLLTVGLSVGLLVQSGVRYARLMLLGLLFWFIAGILLDRNTGIFGMYDPVLIITQESLSVANYGVLWLSFFALIFSGIIIFLSGRFDWLRITTNSEIPS